MKKNALLIKLSFALFSFTILSFAQNQIGSEILGASNFKVVKSTAMSSDGNYIVVRSDNNSGTNVCAKIFEKNSTNQWVQLGNDIVCQNVDFQCHSVSMSANGNILAIGTGTFTNNQGCVKVYQKDNSNNWIQIGNDIIGLDNERAGYSIKLSANGNIIAVGAPGTYGTSTYGGLVRIFEFTNGNWAKIGSDILGVSYGNINGHNVSLSDDGTVVAMGAPFNADNGMYSGQVRVFKNTLGSWTQVGNAIYGEFSGDLCGENVVLSSDGSTLAVSSTDADINNNIGDENQGCVRVFKNIAGNWLLYGNKIYGEDLSSKNGYTLSLSSDGNTLVAASRFIDGVGVTKQRAKIFKYTSGNWAQFGNSITVADNQTLSFVNLSSDGTKLAVSFLDWSGADFGNGSVKIFDLTSILSNKTFELDSFSFYPNPSSDLVIVKTNENQPIQKVNIYNALGEFVKSYETSFIQVNSLAKGNYFLEICTKDGKSIKSLIVN